MFPAPPGTEKPPPGTLPTTRKPPRTYPPDWTGSTEARPTTKVPGTPVEPGKQKGRLSPLADWLTHQRTYY